ncbi:MAG: hypothetical protein KatS3mg003_1673 [Candidatus Nitrosocaldaceae archaeon]|jgi:rRNA maturation endonuclease Nob1|nr:MAG: hypothetical protein D6752_05480 [Candidatus Nitrosothermus koennekii]GIU72194.1 MAG: hypothetical protein KatS3mg003_1673 [Candidatus Nitrosocaldaceae archaeon]
MKKEEEKPIVYTIEECKKCKHRLKRNFKLGDYVYKDGDACTRCGAQTLITMIYAEYVKV